MAEIVTLDEVLAHLRIAPDERDAETDGNLQALIDAASSLVLGYIRPELVAAAVLGETLPPQVKLAALVLVGIFRANPDQEGGAFADGQMPPTVRAILRQLRRPICV